MNQWERDFARIKLIVRAIYASVLIYAVIVYFRIPTVPYIWERSQQIIFYALLAMVVPMFLASGFIGKQFMDTERLKGRFNAAGGGEIGLRAAIADVQTGAIVMAAIGEACAVYGLVLYFLSGSHTYPFIFFAISAIHYPMTTTRFSKAQEDIDKLAKSY